MEKQTQNTTKSSSAMKNRSFSPALSGIAFTFAAISSFLASFIFSIIVLVAGKAEGFSESNGYVFLGYLLPQIGLLCSIFLICKGSAVPVFSLLPHKKTGAISYIFAFCALFGLLFGLGWINDLFLRFLQLFGYENLQSLFPVMENFGSYLLSVLIIACLPALMEECIFRGIMVSGLNAQKRWVSILLCAFCFSIFHTNPAQTPYQFLCGIVFCIIVFQTENIRLTIGMHFLNNFWILTAQYFKIPAFSMQWNIALGVVGCAALALAMWYFLKRPTLKEKQTKSIKPFFLSAAVGFIICMVFWVSNFVSGMA